MPIDALGGTWKKTSYNGNSRKHYEGVGYTYDVVKDAFIPPRPFKSWSLDKNCDWQPPIPYPTEPGTEGKMFAWNEELQNWVAP